MRWDEMRWCRKAPSTTKWNDMQWWEMCVHFIVMSCHVMSSHVDVDLITTCGPHLTHSLHLAYLIDIMITPPSTCTSITITNTIVVFYVLCLCFVDGWFSLFVCVVCVLSVFFCVLLCLFVVLCDVWCVMCDVVDSSFCCLVSSL